MFRRAFSAFALSAAAAFCAADDVPRLCPACGFEVAYEETVCHNCGGNLADVPVPGAEEPEPPPPAPAAGASLAAALRDDWSFARRAGSDPFAALAALRDAAALLALDPAAAPEDRRAAVLARRDEAFAALSRETVRCPLCEGKGTLDRKKPPKGPAPRKGTLEADMLDLKTAPAAYSCPFCGGHGRVPRIRDRKKLLDDLRLGERTFRRLAEKAGRERRAGAFVPAGWFDSLDAAARAAAADRAPPPDCAPCAGTGTVPCRACGGFGLLPCRNAAAHAAPKAAAPKSGGVRVEDYRIETAPANAARCPDCGGSWDAPGAVRCPDCGGKGLSACGSCRGSGHGR